MLQAIRHHLFCIAGPFYHLLKDYPGVQQDVNPEAKSKIGEVKRQITWTENYQEGSLVEPLVPAVPDVSKPFTQIIPIRAPLPFYSRRTGKIRYV